MSSTGDDTPPPFTAAPPPPRRPKSAPPHHSRPSPASIRDDCWSESATHALIDAWGSRHLSLNRGNLRQHHWQEVAATVNSGGAAHPRRTDVQCKNRIDTLKKKYKIEKSRSAVDSAYVSPWPFFSRLDFLISGAGKFSPAPVPTKFPVRRRSAKQKRPAERWNFAVVAALAEERESSEGTSSGGGGGGGRRSEREEEEAGDGSGCRELAEAIRRFGEVYERVEGMKQDQLIELEKHRMQFAKDLEYQRMKLLMDTQLQLARIKRSKHSDDADGYL